MRRFLTACACLSLFGITGYAQLLDSTLATVAARYQPEKIYIQYDKSAYYNGETIWFKAYVMDGLYPATTSKTLYVDWIAENGNVLSHTVSPIVDGATNGQYEVPAEFKDEVIHVRAYTKWMLNFDTAFLYSKDIRIIPKEPGGEKIAVGIIPSIQFFPEGGDIIAGITNRIAFKANDQFGRPVKVKGRLLDNQGKQVTDFVSVHDGMGSFYFMPQDGSPYIAKWTDEKKVEHTTTLPAARPSGVSMQVLTEGKKKVIIIHANKGPDADLQRLYLVGTMNQAMVFKNEVALTDANNARRVIPTDKLLTGLLTLTLFDANWKPVIERVTFVNNNDYAFEPQVEVQRWGLGKRKRNELEIRVPAQLQGANLSIAVTDAAIERDTADNLVSHFLLSSEIRGRIYNPAYYFSSKSDSVSQHLELVMMTHGWRRFKWEDIAKGKLPPLTYGRDTSYLTLSGQVFGVARNQLSGKESIALIIREKDSASRFLIMGINPDGRFFDPSIILFDTIRVYYSLKAKFLAQAEARFMTDRLPAPNYTAFSRNFMYSKRLYDTSGSYYQRFLADKALEIASIERGRVLKTVVIETTRKSPIKVMDDKYTSGMFKGGDGYQFDLVNDPVSGAYMSVFDYLQGKVAGLQINTGTMPPSLSWRGGVPTVFLDEMQTDTDMLSNIPVNDIAYVKVFRPPFMGAVGGGSGGAIAIYTKKGGDQTTGKGGLSANTVAGYSPIKQFYSPNYDSFDPRNDRLDIRTTLYWNPLVSTTPAKNSIKFNFHNNDITKSFRVVIEGVTADGLLTHYEQIME